MGLAVSLAEALNIGWDLLAGDVHEPLKDRVRTKVDNAAFRRRIAKGLETHLDGDLRAADLRPLIENDSFIAYLVDPSDPDLQVAVEPDLRRALGADAQATMLAELSQTLVAAVTGAIDERATLPERLLLARVDDLAQTQLHALDLAIATEKAIAELDVPPELSPFADQDGYVTWLAARRGGLVDTDVAFVPPPDDDPAHPARILQRLTQGQRLSALLLYGPGGTGKTRTCLEVASRATREGWRVVHVLPGEPMATTVDLMREVLRADGLCLVVLDYLNELQGIDLQSLGDRLSLAASARGTTVALLGSARSGWLSTRPPLGPFERVELCLTSEHLQTVSSGIVRQTAPTAARQLGLPEVERLCGTSRPMISLLISRELERLAAAGMLDHSWTSATRSGDLVAWLRRRFDEDGFSIERPATAAQRHRVPVELVLATAVVASLPDTEDAVLRATESAAARQWVEPTEAGRVLRLLQELGWVNRAREGLSPVHDVVADFLITEILNSDQANAGTESGDAILSGALKSPRTLGRLAGNLGRVIADLRVTDPERHDEFNRYCDEWLTRNTTSLAETLTATASPDEVSYALGAVLDGPPWMDSAVTLWDDLIDPWLAAHRTSTAARHLLYKGLRNAPVGRADDLIAGGLIWLATHGDEVSASFVLSALLNRPDLRSNDQVERLAEAWLQLHGGDPASRYVLTAVLGLGTPLSSSMDELIQNWLAVHNDEAAVAAVLVALLKRPDIHDQRGLEQQIVRWLTDHGKDVASADVLRALIDGSYLFRPQHVLRVALGWLESHGLEVEAGPVLSALLRRPSIFKTVRLEQHALSWLEANSTSPVADATFLLRHLLNRPHLHSPADVETRALTWLTSHNTEPTAAYVLGPLLKRPHLDNPTEAERHALVWLTAQGGDFSDESIAFVLPPLLSRPTSYTSKQIEKYALAWLAAPHASSRGDDATFVLRQLLNRQHLENPRQVEEHALVWLATHNSDPSAAFVLAPLLNRSDLSRQVEALRVAFRWLAAQTDDQATGHVLVSLLRHVRRSERPGEATETLRRYLQNHLDSSEKTPFILAKVLRHLPGHRLPDMAPVILQWARAAGTHGWSMPITRTWLSFCADYVLRPVLADASEAVDTTGVAILIARLCATFHSGLGAAIVDDVVVDWLQWDKAIDRPAHPTVKDPAMAGRVMSLVHSGRLTPSDPGIARFRRWISDDDPAAARDPRVSPA